MLSPEVISEFAEKYGMSPNEADIETFASIFHEAYGVMLDDAGIKTAVSNILINNPTPEARDRLLKEYVKESFRAFAVPHAKQRQIESVGNHGYSTSVNAVGMLDLYIDIVSYAALIASDEQLELMKSAQEEAKKSAQEDVRIANEASDAANKAIEKKEFGAKQKAEEATKLVDKAKLRMQRANDPENFYFRSWEPSMPKFGLTSAEARTLCVDCVNSANSIKYAEHRREEINEYGVTHLMFIQIVKDIDANSEVTDYKSAAPRYQEALRNVYVTRELMNTRLESMNRRNWFWRFFNRAQIKAAKSYVSAADGLLAKVQFPEELKASTMAAATTQGIRAGYSDLDDSLKEIDQVFAEADRAVEARNQEELQKQEEKRKAEEQERLQKETEEKLKKEAEEKAKKEAEEKAKREKEERQANRKEKEEAAKKAIVGREAEIRAEAEALAREKKPLSDALFDIRFRPSLNKDESKKQRELCVEIGNQYIMGKKNLPAGVKAVFEANYSKIIAVRNFVKNDLDKLEPVELQTKFKELDTQFAVTEEMVKMEHASAGIDYRPITLDQLKLQQDLAKDFSSNVTDAKNAEPVVQNAPHKEVEQLKS